MKMNLIQRAGLWIAGLGLAAGAVGCEGMTAEERQAVGFLGGLMYVSPNATPSEAGAGALIRDEALRIDEQEARLREARAGKTEVNVNIDGSQTRTENPLRLENPLKLREKRLEYSNISSEESQRFIKSGDYDHFILKDGRYVIGRITKKMPEAYIVDGENRIYRIEKTRIFEYYRYEGSEQVEHYHN